MQQLNFNAVLLDNTPVATHLAKCAKCRINPAIRQMCTIFYSLLFAPIDAEELAFDHERMIREVQTGISKITGECTFNG